MDLEVGSIIRSITGSENGSVGITNVEVYNIAKGSSDNLYIAFLLLIIKRINNKYLY